jgi:hypothetical protein
MAREPNIESSDPPLGRAAHGLLIAGVAGACVLGIGLGLWARPATSERRLAATAAKAVVTPAPARQLQIVVDDRPAPIGEPLEVMPRRPGTGVESPAQPALATDPAPFTILPPQTGLLRVQAIAPPPPLASPPAPARVRREPVRKTVALAAPATRSAHGIEKAPGPQVRAKAEDRRIARLQARQKKQRKIELAEARAEQAEADAREKAAQARRRAPLLRLVHALANAIPHKAAPAKDLQDDHRHVREAREARRLRANRRDESRRETARLHDAESAEVRAEKLRRTRAERSQQARIEARRAIEPPARDPRVIKVAARNRCASSDPGAAMVCSDRNLGAVDRQMARAVQQAQAAGVSPDDLQRQEKHWLAARSAAAREAPWAVHDVYLAHIAELRDMTRDARGGY